MLLDNSRVGTKKVKYAFLGDEQVYGEHFKYQLTADNIITLTITVDSTLMAGIDFPADTDISLCMCGGAGSGAAENDDYIATGGGRRGEITQAIINYPSGTVIAVDIGSGGGSVNDDVQGIAGTQSAFDTHIALGGAGGIRHTADYASDGKPFISPCDGEVYYDGAADGYSGYGGQAGAFGNGGRAVNDNPAGGGGIGAGGGGATWSQGGGEPSGPGGRGQVVLKWEKEI